MFRRNRQLRHTPCQSNLSEREQKRIALVNQQLAEDIYWQQVESDRAYQDYLEREALHEQQREESLIREYSSRRRNRIHTPTPGNPLGFDC